MSSDWLDQPPDPQLAARATRAGGLFAPRSISPSNDEALSVSDQNDYGSSFLLHWYVQALSEKIASGKFAGNE
jgi:hypothetical protein